MTNDSDINGTLLRHQRESMGWTLADMAAKACLSPKQIKQLEEGGDTAFYSLSIKLSVAKKVAQILGVTEDELFSRIKAPKSSTLNESIEDIEAEQLALLASFESDPVLEDEKHMDEIAPVLTGLKEEASSAPVTKEVTTESASKSKNQSDPVTPQLSVDGSATVDDHKDPVVSAEPTVAAPLLKSPAQEVRGEAVSPSNFLSNADSHITQEPTATGMNNGLKFLLFAVLVFAAVVVLSPEVKNNLIEMGRQNGLLESVGGASTESAAPNPPPLDASQSDTPVEAAPVLPSAPGTPQASSSAPVQVAKPTVASAPNSSSSSSTTTPATNALVSSNPVAAPAATVAPSSSTP